MSRCLFQLARSIACAVLLLCVAAPLWAAGTGALEPETVQPADDALTEMERALRMDPAPT